MIISRSNNFAFTRPPKTGGASLAIYILESGLADGPEDEYELEGNFSSWQEFKAFSDTSNNFDYSKIPPELYNVDNYKKANIMFQDLVDSGRVHKDMPCIGVIRHPFDWISSLFYYANKRREINMERKLRENIEITHVDRVIEKAYSTPDLVHKFIIENAANPVIQNILKPQTDYYPDHAELFNFENLHEHACEFIESKGGKVPEEKIQLKASDHDPTSYIDSLSQKYKERALKVYKKDLIAWEKAYAKFN